MQEVGEKSTKVLKERDATVQVKVPLKDPEIQSTLRNNKNPTKERHRT